MLRVFYHSVCLSFSLQAFFVKKSWMYLRTFAFALRLHFGDGPQNVAKSPYLLCSDVRHCPSAASAVCQLPPAICTTPPVEPSAHIWTHDLELATRQSACGPTRFSRNFWRDRKLYFSLLAYTVKCALEAFRLCAI